MNLGKTILSTVLSSLYYLCFGLVLCIFHPIQWLCFKLIGYQAHKKSVDYLNRCLISCLWILGTRVKFRNTHDLPKNTPLIFVSNHQGLYDIPPLIWYLRKSHPKFVSKIELGKGIPSVSYNLRHGGSVLINRRDPKQSIPAIKKFAQYIADNNRSAVIFPEGTRSRNGQPKRFSENGIRLLSSLIPNAYIVPISINNAWKIERFGQFPLDLGQTITFDVHQPIKCSDYAFEDLFKTTETVIKDGIKV